MGRNGDCRDNAVAESFFEPLEQEPAVREPDWAETEVVRAGVLDYIVLQLRTQAFEGGQQSPAAFERRWAASQGRPHEPALHR